jgi:YD repeat-containing protein
MKTRVNTTLSQTTTYNWDDDNRLVSVVLPSGETITYTYDILGRMLTRLDSSTGLTTYFVWDGMIPIQETTGTTVTNY